MSLRPCLALLLPVLLAGCDAPLEGVDDLADADFGDDLADDVATDRTALCALFALPDHTGNMILTGTIPGPHASELVNTSPNAAYDNAGCSERYVVQANFNALTRFDNMTVHAAAGQALTQAQCIWSQTEFEVLVRDDGDWETRGGLQTRAGQWTGSTCTYGSPFVLSDTDGIDRITVVARAVYVDGTGEHKARVQVRVDSWNPI